MLIYWNLTQQVSLWKVPHVLKKMIYQKKKKVAVWWARKCHRNEFSLELSNSVNKLFVVESSRFWSLLMQCPNDTVRKLAFSSELNCRKFLGGRFGSHLKMYYLNLCGLLPCGMQRKSTHPDHKINTSLYNFSFGDRRGNISPLFLLILPLWIFSLKRNVC